MKFTKFDSTTLVRARMTSEQFAIGRDREYSNTDTYRYESRQCYRVQEYKVINNTEFGAYRQSEQQHSKIDHQAMIDNVIFENKRHAIYELLDCPMGRFIVDRGIPYSVDLNSDSLPIMIHYILYAYMTIDDIAEWNEICVVKKLEGRDTRYEPINHHEGY